MRQAVLIVDDRPENISLVVGLLKEMGLKQKVYSAPNGQIAYDLALKYQPNLILTDWDMPVMNGLELVVKLKENNKVKHIPVVMITGVMTEPEQLQLAFAAGVHDFIRKPYNSLEFFARVGNTLKLQQAYNDIARAKDELHDLNALKDNIFSVISHDVNEPLAGLSGLVSLTVEGRDDISEEELTEYYTSIDKQITNILTLLRNLLEWSQSQIDDELAEQEVSPHQLVVEIFKHQNVKAFEKGVELTNLIPEDLKVVSDPNMLSFILRNLIVNALKFTDQGSITVDAVVDGSDVTFSVSDTGVGMDESTLSGLLRGFRVVSSMGTNEEKGTGIGLTLCNEYIRKHNGKMNISSTLGKGSTFSFTLPKMLG